MKRKLLLILFLFAAVLANATTYSAYTVVNAANNQSIYVQVDDVANEVKMILAGNSNKYMAFGFNATNMSGGTYTINTNGTTVQERTLGGYSAGALLTSSFTLESDVTASGIRIVTLTRDLAGISPAYFDFTPAATAGFSLPIIWAHGSSTTFGYHQSRGATTLVFAQDCYTPTSDVVTSCESSYTSVDGQVYTTDGIYIDTTINVSGCDLIYTLDLTFAQPTNASISVTECSSYTVPSGSETYTVSGVYSDTLVNAAGCDSIISIALTLNSTQNTISETVCDAYTSPSGLATYTTSGVYTDVIQNAAGCDSILTINLTVNESTAAVEDINTCGAYVSNGNTYTSSGTYTEILTNANGCDSVRTINLTLSPLTVLAQIEPDGLSASTSTVGDTYQWIDCSTNAPVVGAISNTFTPSAAGDYAVVVNAGTCSDTSACLTLAVANIQAEEKDISLTLHPNPTTGDVVLRFAQPQSGIIRTTNVLGEQVKLEKLDNTLEKVIQIDGNKGLYFLEVSTSNKKITRRIIKQ